MSSREDTPEPGTSAASTSQAAPAAPQDDSRESGVCPECRHISTACSGSCRHCFCQLCLWDWSLGQAVCPRCQRPTRHPYPQHVALYHEVQDRVYDRKRRRSGLSARLARSSSWHWGHGRPWERRRRRRRSIRWPRYGSWHSQHAQGSESPSRRWWQQQRRAWEDMPEEGRTPRFEWAIPASSRGNRSRHRSRRSWSHRRWSRGRERSHGWDRRWTWPSWRDQDTLAGSHSRPARQRRWRSWDVGDRRAPRPQHGVPSERSEPQHWEGSDFSRQWHTSRRRTRGRSHRRGPNSQGPHDHSTNQRRCRSWNADDRRTPRRDFPSRRSERHQWEGWDSSRGQHVTRSRTRGRSHRRGQNSRPASQGTGPRSHSARQRHWRSWNFDRGRSPRSQRGTQGSSGRSWHRHWSPARHRDT